MFDLFLSRITRTMNCRLLSLLLGTSFLFITLSARAQMSVADYLKQNDPAISFDSVAGTVLYVIKEKGKFGMMNVLGNWVIPPVYSQLGNIDEETNGPVKLNWKNGIIIVRKNGKFGALNCYGKEVIPCKYTDQIYFSDGIFNITDNTGRHFCADKTGKEIFSPGKNTNFVINNGLFRVSLADEHEESEWSNTFSYALINAKGDTVLQLKNAEYIIELLGKSEGMTAFVMYPIIFGGLGLTHGTVGFLNEEGKIAVPPIYSAKFLKGGRGMSSWEYKPAYHGGLALVFKGDTSVYIDKTGKEILNFSSYSSKVGANNDFNKEGIVLIEYQINEQEKVFNCTELIDTLGRVLFKSKSGNFGQDGLGYSDISQLETFFFSEKEGLTLYNSKAEKQFFLPRSDEQYTYSFFTYSDGLLTCVWRKSKQTRTSEYAFVDRKGVQISPFITSEKYFDPLTKVTITKKGPSVVMSNENEQVLYTCDSCFNETLSNLRYEKFNINTNGVYAFKLTKGKESIFVNYKGQVLDRFPSKENVITYFENSADQNKAYNTLTIPEIKIAVKQAEWDKIYAEMPWNKRNKKRP